MDEKCKDCLWNERVRCGKDYCVLPKCVRPWKKEKPKKPKKEGG